MQVTSANSFTPHATASLAVENSVRVTEQGDRLTARQDNQSAAEQEQTTQQQTRFDVDQQAIARLEQQQLNTNSQASANTDYDQPSQANQTAVSAYQSVDNIAQRESIQQTFGVDLYA